MCSTHFEHPVFSSSVGCFDFTWTVLLEAFRCGQVLVAKKLKDMEVELHDLHLQYLAQSPCAMELFQLFEDDIDCEQMILQSIKYNQDRLFDHLVHQIWPPKALFHSINYGNAYAASRCSMSDADFYKATQGSKPANVEVLKVILNRKHLDSKQLTSMMNGALEQEQQVPMYLAPFCNFIANAYWLLIYGCVHGHFDLLRQLCASDRLLYPQKSLLLEKSDFEILRHLFEDPLIMQRNGRLLKTQTGRYATHSLEIVEYMLQKDVEVDQLLQSAIKYSNTHVLEFLLSKAVIIDQGCSLLQFAVENNSFKSLLILIKDSRIRLDVHLPKILKSVVEYGNFGFVQQLLVLNGFENTSRKEWELIAAIGEC
ncbi:hypothetical protein EDD86DRAFT_211727 [Gorgonomyces haynaldii]|nr:hypothetical protein EDD86DRAFT_211727 [Gorgonomyces haynaldii]